MNTLLRFFIVALALATFSNVFSQNTFPSTGNVGVGTDIPDAQLAIYKNVGNEDFVKIGLDTGSAYGNRVTLGTSNWHGVVKVYDWGGNTKIKFDGNSDALNYINAGKFGIGNTVPKYKLDVYGGINVDNNYLYLDYGKGIRLDDTTGVEQNLIKTEWIHNIGDATKIYAPGSVHAGEILTVTSYNQGSVWIGNTDSIAANPPVGAKLAVDGNIICEELRVKLSENWGDFVFDDSYELKSLEEEEVYIKENNHLSGIPSAKEIEEKGMDVGEMQRLQMIKIEELTLHIIELKKELEALKSNSK